MKFLYGDSKPSPLKANFLEFLRDALDFSVFALDSDARIKEGKAQIRRLGTAADEEQARLERFVGSVLKAVEQGEKGEAESPTDRCAARISALVGDARNKTIDELRRRLDEETARIDAAEAAARAACKKALGTLLAPHDLHAATKRTALDLGSDGRYSASFSCTSSFGLAYEFELGVPDDHLWAAPVRLERFEPHLEINAPQLTGWISKEVKVRPQRLERQVVSELVDDGSKLTVKLRSEPGAEAGYDAEIDSAGRVKMARVGPADDASVGAFDVESDDAAKLLALAEKLRASVAELSRGSLTAATFEDGDFTQLREFTGFVRTLVSFMEPIVKEISDHSLTPNELVIRRSLANDRREEFFVPKGTLREKYASLNDELRGFFAPLGLDGSSPVKPVEPSIVRPEPPAVRAEIARSQPPPPLRSPSDPDVEVTTEEGEELSEDSLEEVPASGAAVEVTSDEMLAAAPLSTRTVAAFGRSGGQRNEALVATLKRIALLARAGRTDDAYRAYSALFASREFMDYRPEDQRQAMRLMLLAKSPPTKSDDVILAHRRAIERLGKLIEVAPDPIDYELIGVAHLFVGESDKASDAFKKGLELERERNPQSELVGTLMRRLSAI